MRRANTETVLDLNISVDPSELKLCSGILERCKGLKKNKIKAQALSMKHFPGDPSHNQLQPQGLNPQDESEPEETHPHGIS